MFWKKYPIPPYPQLALTIIIYIPYSYYHNIRRDLLRKYQRDRKIRRETMKTMKNTLTQTLSIFHFLFFRSTKVVPQKSSMKSSSRKYLLPPYPLSPLTMVIYTPIVTIIHIDLLRKYQRDPERDNEDNQDNQEHSYINSFYIFTFCFFILLKLFFHEVFFQKISLTPSPPISFDDNHIYTLLLLSYYTRIS